MNKIDYQIADNLCAKILEDFNSFPEFEEMHGWLETHKDLYDRFNIEPKGLPAICSSNYQGVRYENIAKFQSLYQKTKYEYNLLDHMSHEEVIIYFIERMDAFMIQQYLLEKEYMGMGFRDFIYKLSLAFNELHGYRGNNSLRTEAAYCAHCNEKQYFFIGEYDESYLHLVFKLEKGIVKHLIECRELKCDMPNFLDPKKQVFVNTEKSPF
jgi:hypothetical protein